MDIVQSVQIKASPGRVFGLYADIASWCDWDSEVLAVALPGLEVGAVGWLQPRNGPRAKLEVVEATPDQSFTVESRLPLCRMQFGHELKSEAALTTATHWVQFSGPLSPLFRFLIGTSIARSLPRTLAGLKRAAEEAGHLR